MPKKILSILLSIFLLLSTTVIYAEPAAKPEIFSKTSVNDAAADWCYLNEIFSVNIYIKDAPDLMSVTLPLLYDTSKAVLLDKDGHEVGANTEKNNVITVNPKLELLNNGIYPEFDTANGFARLMLISLSDSGAVFNNEETLLCTLKFRAKNTGFFGYKIATDQDIRYDVTTPMGIVYYGTDGGESPIPYKLDYTFPQFEIKKDKSPAPEVVYILLDNTVAVGGLVPGAAVTLYDDSGKVLGSGTANNDGLFAMVNVGTSNGVNATQTEPYKDESDQTAGIQGNYTRILASVEPNQVITVSYGTTKESLVLPAKVKGKIGVEIAGYAGMFVFPEIVEMAKDGDWVCGPYNASTAGTYDFYVSPIMLDNVTNKYNLQATQQVVVSPKQTVTGGGGGGGGGTTYAPMTINCLDRDTKAVLYTQKVERVAVGSKQTVTAPDLDGYTLAEGESKTKELTIANSTTANVIEFLYVKSETKTPGLLNDVDHYRYLLGYPDGTIRPEREITREEVAAIFFRLLTKDTRQQYRSRQHTFPDVASDRWSLEEIGTMANMKIVLGYEDGEFKPDQSITRAEFSAISMRFDTLHENPTHGFTDISGHWAEKYIASAYQMGWVDGYEDGTFKPNQPITRTEAAKLINRVLKRRVDQIGLKAELVIHWPDLPIAHWGYYELMEATISHEYERRFEDRVMENWTGKGTDVDFRIDN